MKLTRDDTFNNLLNQKISATESLWQHQSEFMSFWEDYITLKPTETKRFVGLDQLVF